MLESITTARVGQSSLHVPLVGLGTASIGNLYADVSETQAVDTVHYALEHGVNFFDTAPFYSEMLVEERLGRALVGVPRDSYILATKVGRLWGPNSEQILDFSRDGILKSLEGSLKRLKTDHFDILHIHDPDKRTYRTAIDEAYPLLAEMRAQGMVKAIGVGMNYWEMLVDFARDGKFDCFLLAGRYTLLEQGALNLLNTCYAQGISVFGAGIFNTGILAKGAKSGVWYQYSAASSAILDRVRQIEAVCARYDVALNAAAVQFVRAHPAITALIIGAESPAQLEQNLDALRAPIPPEFWSALRASGLIDEAAPVPGSTVQP